MCWDQMDAVAVAFGCGGREGAVCPTRYTGFCFSNLFLYSDMTFTFLWYLSQRTVVQSLPWRNTGLSCPNLLLYSVRPHHDVVESNYLIAKQVRLNCLSEPILPQLGVPLFPVMTYALGLRSPSPKNEILGASHQYGWPRLWPVKLRFCRYIAIRDHRQLKEKVTWLIMRSVRRPYWITGVFGHACLLVQ